MTQFSLQLTSTLRQTSWQRLRAVEAGCRTTCPCQEVEVAMVSLPLLHLSDDVGSHALAVIREAPDLARTDRYRCD